MKSIKELKKMGIVSLMTLLSVPMLQSCLDDHQQNYSQLTIGTVEVIEGQDYYFALDAVHKMYPGDTTHIHNYRIQSGQRAFVYFELLDEKVPGYDYNAIIYRIENILTKEVLRIPAEETEETIGDDRINITNIWIADDYLNIQYQLLYDNKSEKKHLLNLVVNEANNGKQDTEGYVTLEFRHNAFQEKEEQIGNGLISFKLDKIDALLTNKKGLNIRYRSLYEGVKYKTIDFH